MVATFRIEQRGTEPRCKIDSFNEKKSLPMELQRYEKMDRDVLVTEVDIKSIVL